MYSPIRLVLLLTVGMGACSADTPSTPGVPAPVPAPVLLKDIEIDHLPSPYYHFDYDSAGRVKAASFASGLRMYDVTYEAGRIKEMANNALGNRDRLEYTYDSAGRVTQVGYVDANDVVFTRVRLSYDGQKLTGMVRELLIDGAFVVDRTMSLSYQPDGNVQEITEHRPAIAGRQDETTTLDRYEQYDDGVNVDGFGLVHDDFFDHLVLLPGVQLQKGNPGRATRTGDGINFDVHYTYAYDEKHRPLTKLGELTITNGQNAGQTIETRSEFSYY